MLLLCAFNLTAKDISEYRLGDRVEETIVTPTALRVIDPDATAVLKDQEAMRVPVILRQDTTVMADVEADLREAFSTTRSNFLRAVERYFNKRWLNTNQVASPEFELVRVTFQQRNRLFPVSTNLAALWAMGDLGQDVQAGVVERSREMMRRPLRDPNAPARIRVTSRARLITVTNRDEELTMENIAGRGKTIPRTNALALDRAKRDFIASFPSEDAAIAKYAASFLKTNCRMEEALTEKLREKQTEALWVLAEYRANEVVARAGELVNAKMLAAFQAMLEKKAQASLKESSANALAEAKAARERIKWLTLAAGVVTLLCVFVTWQWWRRRRATTLLPARIGAEEGVQTPEALFWQQRALAAEQRAERAQEAIRAGVLGQVTHLLRDKIAGGLVEQRKELLDAQQVAATELAALEKRLDELQAPIQERLHAYEERIAELEKNLAAKSEENLELIKAKIALVRRQLEIERAKERLELN